ncbi:MAG: T9SS type A sorting domain-containing protein [Bacteroidetes bacterium]|nr:T9SS type A sorting domain-containing protein [Bacteroidota bacterium]
MQLSLPNCSLKFCLVFVCLLFLGILKAQQTKTFEQQDISNYSHQREYKKWNITKKNIFKINVQQLKSQLSNAPIQYSNGTPTPIEIPLTNGQTEIFKIVETQVLAPNIAKEYPDIKTYMGVGLNNPKLSVTITITGNDFNAVVYNAATNENMYFEKYAKSVKNTYIFYNASDAIAPASKNYSRESCEPHFLQKKTSTSIISSPTLNNTFGFDNNVKTMGATTTYNNSTGSTVRTFRLAVTVTSNFTTKHGGVTNAFNDIVAYINRVNAIYLRELSAKFQLVTSTNTVIASAASDPFVAANLSNSAMLPINQRFVDSAVGDANYDIGFVITADPATANSGSSGGGIALSPSVGQTGDKAQNAMTEGDWVTGFSQIYTDQVIAHEMGHQFGMAHSYNSSIPVCTTRNGPTSVEPGSGCTIMSYGFTCGSDDYVTGSPASGPVLNFHSADYDQAVNYLTSTNYNGVDITAVGSTITNSSYQAINITIPSNYTIPISTPFVLTGSATGGSSNGSLTYSWEGMDTGQIAPNTSTFTDATQPPYFRSYNPISSGTRYFPILSAVLNGTNAAPGDKLPSVAFVLNNRLTVRDNNPNGGAVAYKTVQVTIDAGQGPFLITNDFKGTYSAGANATVTWSVNNTNTASPNVTILLSTDGGSSFPTTLLASTANNGSASITFPNNINTNAARIKIQPTNNIYFDISNYDFAISNQTGVVWTGVTNTNWNTNSNWNTNNVPGTSDSVIIAPVTAGNNIPIITASTSPAPSVKYITVQNGGILVDTSTVNITTNGIALKPGGSLIAGTNNITFNTGGGLSVQQNIAAQRGWRLFNNPFNGAVNIASVAAANNITISTTPNGATNLTDSRIMDPNASNFTWTNVTSSTWAANIPYGLFIRGLANEVNGSVYSGNGPSAFTYSVTNNALNTIPYNGNIGYTGVFALVGNPFYAPVKSIALTGGTSLPYYVYQIGVTSAPTQKAGNWSPVMSSNASNTIPVLGVIAFVPSSSTYTVYGGDINTTGTMQTGLFGANDVTNYLELEIDKGNDYGDKLFVKKDANATGIGIDKGDLKKLYNDDINIYCITTDSLRLAIDARKDFNTTIPLGVYGSVANYTFKINNNNLTDTKIVLRDKLLNKETELINGASYSFSITNDAATKGEQRFELAFTSKEIATLPANNAGGAFSAKLLGNIISNDQPIKIQIANSNNAVIQVKDINGRTIAIQAAINGVNNISMSNAALGMYIVQTTDGNTVITDKVIKQ